MSVALILPSSESSSPPRFLFIQNDKEALSKETQIRWKDKEFMQKKKKRKKLRQPHQVYDRAYPEACSLPAARPFPQWLLNQDCTSFIIAALSSALLSSSSFEFFNVEPFGSAVFFAPLPGLPALDAGISSSRATSVGSGGTTSSGCTGLGALRTCIKRTKQNELGSIPQRHRTAEGGKVCRRARRNGVGDDHHRVKGGVCGSAVQDRACYKHN